MALPHLILMKFAVDVNSRIEERIQCCRSQLNLTGVTAGDTVAVPASGAQALL